MQSLLDVLSLGGPIGIAMAVASLAILAVALGRFHAVWSFRRAISRADEQIVNAIRTGDFEGARRLCETVPSPVREVFTGGLDRVSGRVRGDVRATMVREMKRSVAQVRSQVWILGTSGAMMPFVGLFGTVLGVMSSFQQIGATGQGGFAVVSAGISEALITTAIGLFVALEAVLFYNMLQSFIASTQQRLGLLVDETLEILTTPGVERAGPPSA